VLPRFAFQENALKPLVCPLRTVCNKTTNWKVEGKEAAFTATVTRPGKELTWPLGGTGTRRFSLCTAFGPMP